MHAANVAVGPRDEALLSRHKANELMLARIERAPQRCCRRCSPRKRIGHVESRKVAATIGERSEAVVGPTEKELDFDMPRTEGHQRLQREIVARVKHQARHAPGKRTAEFGIDALAQTRQLRIQRGAYEAVRPKKLFSKRRGARAPPALELHDRNAESLGSFGQKTPGMAIRNACRPRGVSQRSAGAHFSDEPDERKRVGRREPLGGKPRHGKVDLYRH